MGRRDAVQVVLEVVSRMRALEPRLIVTYEPGWETRGNGTSANYEGGIWHHTASASSASRPFPTQGLLKSGRPGLSGPLCNFAGPWCTTDAPRLHVTSAHPANHAGASGGRSMGVLPRTSLFNPRVLGLEIDYAGCAAMTDGQRRVALIWGRAVADVVGGGNPECLRGHAETSVTGKWDPGYAPGKTVDLAAMRQAVKTLTATTIAPLEDDDTMRYAAYRNTENGEVVLAAPGQWTRIQSPAYYDLLKGRKVFDSHIDVPPNEFAYLRDYVYMAAEANDEAALRRLEIIQDLVTALTGRPAADVDEKALAEALAPRIQSGASPDAIAKAVVAEQDRVARDGDPKTGPST